MIDLETCRCAKYLPTAVRASSLDGGNSGEGLGEMMKKLVKKGCGRCDEHGETELIYINPEDDDMSQITFPVSATSVRSSEYSKFVVVVDVPGVLIIQRKEEKEKSVYYEVASGSIYECWPVLALTLMATILAGIIMWMLVRVFNELKKFNWGDHFITIRRVVMQTQ